MNLRPDLRVDRVEQVTARRLEGLDVGGLLLDVDETLLPAAARTPDPAIVAWARGLEDAGIRLAIVSNGRPGRVASVAAALGVPGRALTGKPWPGAFRRGARTLGLPPERCAMVGDQLFTDVLGARAAGLRTVLVAPLSHGGLVHTRLLRHLEARLLRGGEHGRTVHR